MKCQYETVHRPEKVGSDTVKRPSPPASFELRFGDIVAEAVHMKSMIKIFLFHCNLLLSIQDYTYV